jgi:hypothetical protein
VIRLALSVCVVSDRDESAFLSLRNQRKSPFATAKTLHYGRQALLVMVRVIWPFQITRSGWKRLQKVCDALDLRRCCCC